MSKTHFLLTLMRAEIDKLERLQRLESRYYTTPPEERPALQLKINELMEEIASIGRTVQQCKAEMATA
jgi:hypothetical protein